MSRIFLEHLGGIVVYSCVHCNTALTNRENLMNTRFTGVTGRAYLFRKAVNVRYGDMQQRVMTTGKHWVRDVFCKKCDTRLGWMYEFAEHHTQHYKESHVILECALIAKSDGIDEICLDDNQSEQSTNN